MNFILLAAKANVSVTEVDLPIMVVAQLIVFVGSLVGFWFNIKNKTDMNTRLNKELKEKLNDHITESDKRISTNRQECNDAYTKLENKICLIEKDVKNITVGIANIEGYMKAIVNNKSNN